MAQRGNEVVPPFLGQQQGAVALIACHAILTHARWLKLAAQGLNPNCPVGGAHPQWLHAYFAFAACRANCTATDEGGRFKQAPKLYVDRCPGTVPGKGITLRGPSEDSRDLPVAAGDTHHFAGVAGIDQPNADSSSATN